MDKIKNKKNRCHIIFLHDYIIVALVIFKTVYEKYNDFCLEWTWNEKETKKNIESAHVLRLIFIIYQCNIVKKAECERIFWEKRF